VLQLPDYHRLPPELQHLPGAVTAGQAPDLTDREIPLLKTLDHLRTNGAGRTNNSDIPESAHQFSPFLLPEKKSAPWKGRHFMQPLLTQY
jgi:hypothetical protein